MEVLAYCTGLLPAATVVAAKDTSELVPLAIQIVSITFRMAFEISRRMRLVEDGLYGNWASTILGVTIEKTQKILDEFHISQVTFFTPACNILMLSSKEYTVA